MNLQRKNRKCNILVTAIVVAALLLAMFPVTVSAAEGLAMSTVYTGMSVKAGDSVSYPLTFTNTAEGEEVELSIVSMPEGWEGYFFGNNTSVSHIYVANGTLSNPVNFNVTVPWSVADGSYQIVLAAKGKTLYSELTLTLHVAAEELGESVLSVLLNQQAGSSGSTFSFTTTIRNNTPNEQSYNLASQIPTGWSVAYKVDGIKVAAVTVGPRSSESVSIEITPSSKAKAGKYTVPIAASSASENLTADLEVEITGTYGIEVSTTSGLLSYDAYASKPTTFTLTVTNTGNAPLNNVSVLAGAPTGWDVSLSQTTIDNLPAGSTANITVNLIPAENALSGDYMVTIEARTGDAKHSVEFRTTVKTETVWGFTGIALIAAALLGLWFVFHKFGRR